MNEFTELIGGIPQSGLFTLLAALVAILGAFAVQRYLAFRNASVAFRSSIMAALSGLYPIPANWPNDDKIFIMAVLKERFPAMQSAVAQFRDSLPTKRQGEFDAAWNLYRTGNSAGSAAQQDYWHYVPHHGEGVDGWKTYKHDNRLTYQEDFKKNVDWLLSFAKEA